MIRLNSPNLNYLMIAGAIMVYLGGVGFVIPTQTPRAVIAMCTVCIVIVAKALVHVYHITLNHFRFVSGYYL